VPRLDTVERGRECLVVGALESRKGIRLVLHALAAAERDVRLAVVGTGPERAALQALAEQLGIAARVRFVGAVPRDQVMRFVASAAAVVFTGLREEGGLALAEAMLAGAPVIVLAHGGARTIASASVDGSRVALIEPGTFTDTACRIGAAMSRFTRATPARSGPTLDVAQARDTLRAAVERACA
jgi:glycosyltransferase involved in cell wall biosynthesis